MPLEKVYRLIEQDLKKVDQCIESNLTSSVALINTIGRYITQSGGKRFRPILVLLIGRALNCKNDPHLITLASIIELIHTATLLHDDVVDNSALRRNFETSNARWGNPNAVLVGDFIYSRCFQMMITLKNMQVMAILSETTNCIAEGEVLQLLLKEDLSITEASYFDIIHRKTAILFQAAAELAALLSTPNKSLHSSAAAYGLALGSAFQLVDDILDYCGTETLLGKPVQQDIYAGHITLPMIYTLQQASPDEKNKLLTLLKNKKEKAESTLAYLLKAKEAFHYAKFRTQEKIEYALSQLQSFPDSPYKEGLEILVKSNLNRIQ